MESGEVNLGVAMPMAANGNGHGHGLAYVDRIGGDGPNPQGHVDPRGRHERPRDRDGRGHALDRHPPRPRRPRGQAAGDSALASRRADVEAKHRRVLAYLDDRITMPSCFNGPTRSPGSPPAATSATTRLGVGARPGPSSTGPCRAIVTDNVQSARVFEEELAGLGFQLKERAWHQGPGRILAELARNRSGRHRLRRPPAGLARPGRPALRRPTDGLERKRLREPGADADAGRRGDLPELHARGDRGRRRGSPGSATDPRGRVPVGIRVASDDRLAHFRQPGFKAAEIHQRATVAAIGRRTGFAPR